MSTFREPFTLYEMGIKSLTLEFSNGTTSDVTTTLRNGRASYILFQNLVAKLTGLVDGNEGGSSDLLDKSADGFEVKSYKDPDLHPKAKDDIFHTAASSTFGPNNLGPVVKGLLEGGDYEGALTVCRATGYDKNAYYIFTNTGGYEPSVPFRYFIVPTSTVLATISRTDPRKISRRDLLRLIRKRVVIG